MRRTEHGCPIASASYRCSCRYQLVGIINESLGGPPGSLLAASWQPQPDDMSQMGSHTNHILLLPLPPPEQ